MANNKAKSYLLWAMFFGFLLLPLVVLLQFLQHVQSRLPVNHPSVVIISIDTCRMDTLGCYGESTGRTPAIDRLSRHNIQFSRGVAQCPTTAPSHATMLSGTDPSIHRIFCNGMRTDGSVRLLQEFLSEVGYRTGAFISGYSLIDRVTGLGRGFEVYDDEWSSRKIERSGPDTTDAAIRWMQTIDPAIPCMLFLHLFDPHSPYNPPEAFRTNPENSTLTESSTGSKRAIYEKNADSAIQAGDFNVLVKDPTSLTATEADLRRNWANYLEEIASVDRCVSRFLVSLERSGRTDTLVILTSDHGEGFEKAYYFGHGDRLWESAVSIPMILRSHDRRVQPKLVDTPTHHLDILPTVLSACGVFFKHSDYSGMDMMTMVRSERMRTRPFLFCSAPPLPRKTLSQGLMHSVYDTRFKLIWSVNRSEYNLFDLINDPSESQDVKTKFPRIFSGLKQVLTRRQHELNYPLEARLPENLSPRESSQLKTLGYIESD